MTEEQWLSCSDPQTPLASLGEHGMLSDRKARLFAVACCRRIWPMFTDERSRRAVNAAEEHAVGRIDKTVLEGLWDAEGVAPHGHAIDGATALDALWGAGWSSISVAEAKKEAMTSERLRAESERVLKGLARTDIAEVEAQIKREDRAFQAERTAHSAILRDIVGNPFRPVVFDPSWRTPTIVSLAGSTYETRAPEGTLDRGLVLTLGECLADAGCDDAELLEHLRGPSHYRGCFALDLVLGKA
jgi:hypothetical protein